ncbi:hypothetical protein BT69DRAFT_1276343 [Atractiella rhizophila]|nr:hypothetical protein BT69DRAFT_1276343 [Atractiella rhizophila]
MKTWKGELLLDGLGLAPTFSTPNVKIAWLISARFEGPALLPEKYPQIIQQIKILSGDPKAYQVHPNYFVDHKRPVTHRNMPWV